MIYKFSLAGFTALIYFVFVCGTLSTAAVLAAGQGDRQTQRDPEEKVKIAKLVHDGKLGKPIGIEKAGVSENFVAASARSTLSDYRVNYGVHQGVNLGAEGIILDHVTLDGKKGECLRMPDLKMEDVHALAAEAFGLPDGIVKIPKCDSTKVHRSEFGFACQIWSADYFDKLYDLALYSMAIGASKKEAFTPFMHARSVAWSIRACEKSLHEKRHATIPDSYHILYEIYWSKLFAKLRAQNQDTVLPSRDQMNGLIEAVKKLRKKAVFTLIKKKLSLKSLEVEEYVDAHREMWKTTRMSATVHDASETTAGSEMTESGCDSQRDPLNQKLHPLPGIGLFNRYEVCCARQCTALEAAVRNVDITNCCLGCNRWSCGELTAAHARSLSERSVIIAPAKMNAPAQVLSFFGV